MNERIEWIEPEEVARERRGQMRNAFRHWHVFAWGLALSAPAAGAVLLLDLERVQAVGIAFGILLAPLFPLLLRWQMQLNERTQRAHLLKSDDSKLWKHACSFEIADHPTLPGIRTLTIQRTSEPRRIQHSFRIGQLDEVELSNFVESRIAEQRAQRLMRRVRRKL